MRAFALTKLGQRLARDGAGDSPEERRVLQYLDEHKTASDDDLEVAGGPRWVVRRLKREGLVMELTQSEY